MRRQPPLLLRRPRDLTVAGQTDAQDLLHAHDAAAGDGRDLGGGASGPGELDDAAGAQPLQLEIAAAADLTGSDRAFA